MKKKIFRLLATKKWAFDFAMKVIGNTLAFSDNALTPWHLEQLGWKCDGNCWYDPLTKERDRIGIVFYNGFYMVWHGPDKTWIACESSVEWFNVFRLAVERDLRYVLAKFGAGNE
jgi:hypothetical protein